MNIYLVIFLLIDVFLAGVCVPFAVRHARAHFGDKKQADKPPVPMQNGHLPPSVREHLLEEAQANFRHVLNTSAKELQQDLAATAEDIHKLVQKMGTEAVAGELQNYRARLAELQQKTEADMAGVRDAITAHQAELKAKLEADIAAEKERLLTQIDTKLADAVAAFLLDTLQHEVDLGAQQQYLTKMLEEHKEEFKKDLGDEN